MHSTKALLLIIAFIDYMGVGLIYPMFSSMLFDPDFPIVAHDVTPLMRGFYLGLLLCIMPLFQFFSAPYWGSLSDTKGRKKPLISSLILATLGYVLSFFGAFFCSLALLLISRAVIGFASGNTSIIQASLSDLSDDTTRTKNFGLYSMALGTGFTLGPFLGGALSHFGYSAPFFMAFCALSLNILVCSFFLKETKSSLYQEGDKNLFHSLLSIKASLRQKDIRGTFFALFLHNFGWCYFFEFIPVFLFGHLNFSRMKLGVFYAIAGLFYALSAGLLIRPFVDRYKPIVLFQVGLLLTSLVVLSMSFISSSHQIWPLLFLLCFFVSAVTPSATSFVSSKIHELERGKVLGSLSSTNSLALIISPLISGAFVGQFPKMPIWLGGCVIFLAACVSFIFQKKDAHSQ